MMTLGFGAIKVMPSLMLRSNLSLAMGSEESSLICLFGPGCSGICTLLYVVKCLGT